MESGAFIPEKPQPLTDIEVRALEKSLPVLPEGGVAPEQVRSSLDALDKLPGSLGVLGKELLLNKLEKSE